MSRTALHDTPYKGLMPYDEADAPFFFGREHEEQVIISNLMGSRLTLLYGPSGVGKSSVLRAGVVPRMRGLARQDLKLRGKPKMAVVMFRSWSTDPLAGLRKEIQHAVQVAFNREPSEFLPEELSFVELLKSCAEEVDGKLFIILDQFEEYFLYPQNEGEGSFAAEFVRVVNRADLRVNFLVSLREDWYAKLDQFKPDIPKLYDTNLRIELLGYDAAREAIEQPVAKYNKLHSEDQPTVSIAAGFSERVLEQLARIANKNLLSEAGLGVAQEQADDSDPSGMRIQTPYLQLVMTRLWHEAFEKDSSNPVLYPEMLDAREKKEGAVEPTERAEEIVQSHLNDVMNKLEDDERRIAADVFYHMVTPSGTKIAQKLKDLADYAQVTEEEIKPVLDKLTEKEQGILTHIAPAPGQRNVPRYEIFHDVLGLAVLSWTKEYKKARELEETTKRVAEEAAAQAREAERLLRLEQAEALAKKEAQRAEEAQQRAEAERQRREEQERRAEAERRQAEEREQRINAERLHAEAQAVAREREAQQAQALAEEQRRLREAESLRADEQQQRLEAEHQRAEEAALRAEAERLRAEDKGKFSKRLLQASAGLVLLLILSVIAFGFAFKNSKVAESQRKVAELETQRALTAANEEHIARDNAQRQRIIAEEQTGEAEHQRGLAEAAKQEAIKAKDQERIAKEEAKKREGAATKLKNEATLALDAAIERESEAKLALGLAIEREKEATTREQEARLALEAATKREEEAKKERDAAIRQKEEADMQAQRARVEREAFEEQVKVLRARLETLNANFNINNTPNDPLALDRQGLKLESEGKFTEAVESYKRAGRLHEAAGNWASAAKTSTNLGALYFRQRDFTQSLEALQYALNIYKKSESKAGQAELLRKIGFLFYTRSNGQASKDSADAIEYFKQAIDIYDDLHDDDAQAATKDNLGDTYIVERDFGKAIDAYDDARKIYDKKKNDEGVAQMLFNIGYANQLKGDYSEAVKYLESSLDIRRRKGNVKGQVDTLKQLAYNYRQLGQTEKAEQSSRAAEQLDQKR
jgi:tetratricopeptide (TPR) repeat protein